MEPVEQYPNTLFGPEDFTIDGIIEYNNIPLLEEQLNIPLQNQIYNDMQECPTPTVETVPEPTRELKLFGIGMNEHDDFITVGIVFVVAAAVWFTKTYIEYYFAKKLEDYKNK